MKKVFKSIDTATLLSSLWLFAILNYLYCDIIGLMDPYLLKQFLGGSVAGMDISQGFLLGASILMTIPISMVLLSRILVDKVNKWFNIIAGTIMTLVQFATLVFDTPTIYYLFFSILEISCTILIVGIAWKWESDQE